MSRDWDEHYRSGETPWDNGQPEPLFIEAIERGALPRGRLLELGCGTGTNARLFAAAGFEVVAVDLSATAIERARAHPDAAGIAYQVRDILAEELPAGPFDAVIDRGCFHSFDAESERAVLVRRISEALRPGGCWLSLIGSTEGAPRDTGPPRRSAEELARVIEPQLELLELSSRRFADTPGDPLAWWCLTRRRSTPAQPSTRR